MTLSVCAQINGDPTFNQNDLGYISFAGPRSNSIIPNGAGQVFAQVTLANGKILIGGFTNSSYNGEPQNNTNILSRNLMLLNHDGSRDTTFNKNGAGISLSKSIRAIAQQPDGKILIAGTFLEYNGVTVNGVCRIFSDGTIDPTFNVGAGITSNSANAIYCLAVLPSGKILIGGSFSTFNSVTVNNIARLNGDGSLDVTFNSGGSGFIHNGSGGTYTLYSLALQNDGKILVGGSFFAYNGTSTKPILRLTSDGILDNTFAPPASILSANNTPFYVLTIYLRPDGKIWIGGLNLSTNGFNRTGILLLTSTGAHDPSFLPANGAGQGVISAIQPVANNKVLIGGNFTSFNSVNVLKIARINNDGSVDTSFALGNNVYTAASSASISTIKMQNDSSIIFSGYFDNAISSTNCSIDKLTKNHILDTKFNEPTGAKARVKTFFIQADSKIMIGGKFLGFNKINRGRIARLTNDGELDTTYAPSTGANADVNSIVVESNGKVILAGDFTKFNDTLVGRIAKTDVYGKIDTVFLNRTGAGANGPINILTLQVDGKLLVGGNFTLFNGSTAQYIIRLNTDGSLDTTFNTGTGASNRITDIVVQPDGKILVSGLFQTFNSVTCRRITRLNADGSLDMNFGSIGAGFNDQINDIELAPDGSIYLAGSRNNSLYGTSNYVSGIVKLKPNGKIDSSFKSFHYQTEHVFSSSLYPNGKLLISYSTNVNNLYNGGIMRLNQNGTIDAYIAYDSAFDKVMVLGNGNKILACGNFTALRSIGRNRIGRIMDASIAPLPLSLNDFKANFQNNDTRLSWNTSNEINTDKFILERSVNRIDFQSIAIVKSKGNADNSYIFTDFGINSLNSNVVYYRLQMLDKDGKITYSQIILVRLKNKTIISFSPNPTKGVATLQLQTNSISEHLQLKLYNLSGKQVFQQNSIVSLGITSHQLNFTNLQSGIYYLQVSSDLRNEILKVVKQ